MQYFPRDLCNRHARAERYGYHNYMDSRSHLSLLPLFFLHWRSLHGFPQLQSLLP